MTNAEINKFFNVHSIKIDVEQKVISYYNEPLWLGIYFLNKKKIAFGSYNIYYNEIIDVSSLIIPEIEKIIGRDILSFSY